jgi:hypothetical protein
MYSKKYFVKIKIKKCPQNEFRDHSTTEPYLSFLSNKFEQMPVKQKQNIFFILYSDFFPYHCKISWSFYVFFINNIISLIIGVYKHVKIWIPSGLKNFEE